MRCLQSWLRLSTRQTLAPAGHYGARHDDGHKTRSEQITTTTPQLGKESLDKTSLMCISQDIRDLARRRPALGWPEETTRPWPRPHVERTKGKIRLLVHPSSFGEMAPSNLHGYPRALSDNYNISTCIAYHGVEPDRPKIWTDIQSQPRATSARSILRSSAKATPASHYRWPVRIAGT